VVSYTMAAASNTMAEDDYESCCNRNYQITNIRGAVGSEMNFAIVSIE